MAMAIKNLFAVSLLAAALPLSLPAAAGEQGSELADIYFGSANLQLTPDEKRALDIAQRWAAGDRAAVTPPSPGPDGSVNFVFGAHQPSVVCAVFQVCDIQLQPGEQVNSIHLGDTARWTVEPAITGFGPTEIQHLIVKPMDVDLNTTLVVTTNRRTYNVKLRSHREHYMPRVTFTYADDAAAKWQKIQAAKAAERQRDTIPETGEYLGDLDFGYTLSGSAPFKPVRVYNDGRKTILEMPSTFRQGEAPSLLVVRGGGGIFGGGAGEVLVNYRVQGNRYIVDSVFEKAVLVAGVGRSQQKITIEKAR